MRCYASKELRRVVCQEPRSKEFALAFAHLPLGFVYRVVY
jgi:hypothetical protein